MSFEIVVGAQRSPEEEEIVWERLCVDLKKKGSVAGSHGGELLVQTVCPAADAGSSEAPMRR